LTCLGWAFTIGPCHPNCAEEKNQMKPAPFNYLRPLSLAELLDTLSSYGENAKLLAGGQSLMPLLNMRLASPEMIVDISGISELDYVRMDGEILCIGAMTKQYKLERDPLVLARVPFLVPVAKLIGHPQIRHSGTVGGSLAHADPSAELPAAMCVLQAQFKILGSGKERLINAEDFFLSIFTTDLQPDEVLAEIRIPQQSDCAWGIREFSRRAGDFALAGAAVVMELAGGTHCAHGRVVLFGVGDRPLRATAAETYLAGRELSSDGASDFSEACVQGLECAGDLHASGGYRKHLTQVMAKNAYLDAVTMAKARSRAIHS
jgi:CO/xanthine dehydrogenase FAD-binding subunit